MNPAESHRVTAHPILGALVPQHFVSFTFNGQTLQGVEGEPIAAALLAAGIRTLRHSDRMARPRGIYCGIGHCYECRVTVDGKAGLRACLTPVQAGMVITSAVQQPPTPTYGADSHEHP